MAARKKKTAKKAPRKSSALVPVGAGAPSELTEMFQTEIDDDATAAAGDVGWPFFKTQGGVFNYNEEDIGDSMKLIILEAIRENVFYEGSFDPSNPTPPTCFAMNKNADELAPPEDLRTSQADTCKECRWNVFGTAEQGRGKACKNSVRLTVLPFQSGSATELTKCEGARLRVPVTSVRGFAAYVTKLTKALHRPVLSVVTQVKIEHSKTGGFGILFEPLGGIDDKARLEILKARREEGHASLIAPPQSAGEVEAAPKQRRRKVQPRKKKASKKKAKRTRGRARV